jgi:hypothetical protein
MAAALSATTIAVAAEIAAAAVKKGGNILVIKDLPDRRSFNLA